MIKATYFLWCILIFSGCHHQQTQLIQGPVPSDFSAAIVTLTVDNPDPNALAVFVIEPCGTLRAATGLEYSIQTYPEPVAKLEPFQMQKIYNMICSINEEPWKEMMTQYASSTKTQILVTVHGQEILIEVPHNEIANEEEFWKNQALVKCAFFSGYLHTRAGFIDGWIKGDPDKELSPLDKVLSGDSAGLGGDPGVDKLITD